jgi:hypothetical protein
VNALARALLAADAVSHDGMARAVLEAATQGTSLVRALLTSGGIDASRLERHLVRGDAPFMQQIVPVAELARALPSGLCQRLLAVPVRRDPLTGTVDVAVVDVSDTHSVQEIAYWLSAPVRMVQTSLASLDAALERLGPASERGIRSLAAPIWVGEQEPAAADAPATPRYGALPSPPSDAPVAFIELGLRGLPQGQESDPMSAAASTARGPFVPRRSPPPMRPSLFPVRERGVTGRPPSLAPSTRPGHGGDARPAPPSIEPGSRDPARAARDAVLDELVSRAAETGAHAAVFVVRRDGIVGWTASSGACDRERLRSLRWPAHVRSVLQTALAQPEVTTARVPGDAVHAPLLTALALRPGQQVTLAPVHAEGRPLAVLLADDVPWPEGARRLQEIARAAGVSFEQILRRRPAG